MKRRGLSRILVEMLLILLVLFLIFWAMYVFSRFQWNAFDVSFWAEGAIAGDKLVLTVHNVGAYPIVAVNVTWSDPSLGKFTEQEVNVAPGKSSAVVFSRISAEPIQYTVVVEARDSRSSSASRVLKIAAVSAGGHGGPPNPPPNPPPQPPPLAIPSSPVALDTSADYYSICDGHQLKSFEGAGRLWILYLVGNTVEYTSASLADLSSWSSPSQLFTSSDIDYGDSFSIYYDGTFLHIVLVTHPYGGSYYTLKYARVGVHSDGTIDAPVFQDVLVNFYSRYPAPTVAVDTLGYPWIAYEKLESSSFNLAIIKSARNDGVWETAQGYPITLSTGSSIYDEYKAEVLPLSSGRLAVVYLHCDNIANTYIIKSRLYDGSTWLPEETVDTIPSANIAGYPPPSGNVVGDEIHIFYGDYLTVWDYRRTFSTPWTKTTLYYDEVEGASFISSVSVGGNLYCFWANYPSGRYATKIFYSKYSSGAWGAANLLTDRASIDVYQWGDYSQTTSPLEASFAPIFWLKYDGTSYTLMFWGTK